jgi:glycosyltransferase involved in cell wall biosynthesis
MWSSRDGWQLLTWARSRLLDLKTRATGNAATGSAASGSKIRLVFVQYGDYGDAYRRLNEPEGKENYYGQRYTVEFVANLARSGSVSAQNVSAQNSREKTAREIEAITVVTFSRDNGLSELEPRLHAAGVRLYPEGGGAARHAELIKVVAALRPTHLVVAAPIVPLMRWALANEVTLLPLFADSFRGNSLRNHARNVRLAYVLNDPRIRYVANHNLAASLDLARIGVEPSKILPYDWPAIVTPRDTPPKSAPPRDRPFRLIYVGQVNVAKGVGDLIAAVAELKRRGKACTLTVIGSVGDPALPGKAQQLGVSDLVSFLGVRPHPEVSAAMREHDAVVVPSHHAYPEGLPMTLYEGLCSRTPLIVSDHPMFALRIRGGENALVFPAGSAERLADCVLELAHDEALYAQLSKNAENAAQGYLCPLKWDRLIAGFLDPSAPRDIEQYRLVEAVSESALA